MNHGIISTLIIIAMTCSVMAADSSTVSIGYAGSFWAIGVNSDDAMPPMLYGTTYQGGTGSGQSLVGMQLMLGRLGIDDVTAVGSVMLRYGNETSTETSQLIYLPLTGNGSYPEYIPMQYRRTMDRSMLALELGYGLSTQRLVIGPRLHLGYVLDAGTTEALTIEDDYPATFPVVDLPEQGELTPDRRSLVTQRLGIDDHRRLMLGLGAAIGYYYDIGRLRLGLDTQLMFNLLGAYVDVGTTTSDVGVALSIGWTLP